MHNLLVTMSGGTTTVINSTLAGIIEAAQKSNKIDKVYAGIPGVLGFLKGHVVELSGLSKTDLSKLKMTPSSGVTGTTRLKQFNERELQLFKEKLSEYKITYFINLGGNGTIIQTKHLAQNINGFKAISIPKTVDNDLGDSEMEMMYFTPGFPSIVNYWMHKVLMLNNENLGAHSHDRVLVGQTFGRETGFIAGSARMADPERNLPLLILLPEDQRDIAELLKRIKQLIDERGRAIVIMSEGYKIGDVGEVRDKSGQIMYSSSKNLSAQLLVNTCVHNDIQARAFIPGVDQRSEISFTTKFDVEHAYNIGKYAMKQLEKGEFNFLVGIERFNDQIKYCNIHFDTFNDYSRKLNPKYIKYGDFDVTDSYVNYLSFISKNNETVLGNKPFSLDSFITYEDLI